MKKSKKHFLRTLASAAEESVEEAVAEVSGYANAEVMRVALAKSIFNRPDVRKALVAVHKKARDNQVPVKNKPRAREISKVSGHVQASRLEPSSRSRKR